MDIIEYTLANQNGWDTQPLTDADSLVLCQLSYLHLASFGGSTLRQLWAKSCDQIELVCPIRTELNAHLLQALSSSDRLGNVVVLDQKNKFDEATSCQFSATLFDLGEELYLAFRGTDGTLVGWKEDLDLLYKDEIAAQENGLEVLKDYAARYHRPIRVGGHSKGGVLALYAAAFCGQDIQDRILAVYSHDGPGLRSDLTASEAYRNIASRIQKTVPELSIFGMLFNYNEPFRVVQANGSGMYQHLPFNWLVQPDGSFVKGEGLTQGAQIVRQIVETMVPTMSLEDRYLFVSTVYYAFKSANVNTVDEIASLRTVGRVITFNRTLPKETKRTLWRLFFRLVQVSASSGVEVNKQVRRQKRNAKQRKNKVQQLHYNWDEEGFVQEMDEYASSHGLEITNDK